MDDMLINTRRSVIKKIAGTISLAHFSRAALACDPASNLTINVPISKKYLGKFYIGNFEDFLNKEYNNLWIWDKDINVTCCNKNADNDSLVGTYTHAPIKVASNINYPTNKIYCSKIDIFYLDNSFHITNGKNYIYLISSIKLSQKAVPYFYTRIRMSSTSSKIYAAFTFKDIDTNKLNAIKVSSSPANLKTWSCTSLEFMYVNP